LEKQGKGLPEDYCCEYCNKKFTLKSSLQSHYNICSTNNEYIRNMKIIQNEDKYKNIIQDLQDRIEEQKQNFEKTIEDQKQNFEKTIEEQKQNFEKTIEEQKHAIISLQDKLENIALKAISRPTQQINQNNKHVINLAPFDLTQEKAKQIFNDNYTTDHFLQGMKGLVNFVSDHIIKTDTGESIYACYDRSRNVFKYKNEAGEYINDINAFRLVEIIHPAAKETSLIMNVKFHDEYMEALSEYDGDKSNNTVTLDELERKELRTQQACASFLLHQYLNTELDSFSSELGDKIKK
jgi:hypothetical protein